MANKDFPWVDSILIYIYSGWRVSELIQMPTENIDLQEGTFKGGLKTAAGKNRIVPIRQKIRGFVEHRLSTNQEALFLINGKPASTASYTKQLKKLWSLLELPPITLRTTIAAHSHHCWTVPESVRYVSIA